VIKFSTATEKCYAVDFSPYHSHLLTDVNAKCANQEQDPVNAEHIDLISYRCQVSFSVSQKFAIRKRNSDPKREINSELPDLVQVYLQNARRRTNGKHGRSILKRK